MPKGLLFFLVLSVTAIPAFSQIGGKHAFDFVTIPNNAQVAGVGGINISILDQNSSLMFQNPALLNSDMHQKLSLNYIPYVGDIKSTSFAYANKFKNKGTYGLGLQFTHYGVMDWTDDAGTVLGSFTPYDYYLYAGASHTIGLYTMGASLKFAASRLNTLGASALMADFGGVFKHPKKNFTVAIAIKNVGVPVKKYVKDVDTPTPMDVQIGTTFKPEHMPVRISLTAHHLTQFDIAYLDPNVKGPLDLQGNEIKQKISVGEKIGRHFILGTEFILSKNFNLRAGYNYLRRRELEFQTKSGLAGFSFGGMIRIKAFELSYTRAIYNIAGGSSYISITTDLNRLFPKKSKTNSSE
jgi:hypothetical protein